MIRFQFFPRSQGINAAIQEVLDCFAVSDAEITSSQHELSSNDVLAVLRPHLQKHAYVVETGKSADQKISVPVLFGLNNQIDKSFNADAVSADGKIVIEVEAGRALDNNQFLIAVRNLYRGSDDFSRIHTFLETLYISNRLRLPLKGILLIGY